jgi:hypothetical protein
VAAVFQTPRQGSFVNNAASTLSRERSAVRGPFAPFERPSPSLATHWLAETRACVDDTRATRLARIDAAARAGCNAVHVASDGRDGATLCGAAHVELASCAAELGLLYGVVPTGTRQLSASEPWADHFVVEAREPLARELALELGFTGKPLFVRVDAADTARGLAVIDTLVEAGCRRIVVLATASPLAKTPCTEVIDELRRATGMSVGWSEPRADFSRIARAHRRGGARHLVARLDLECDGLDAFEPGALCELRAALEQSLDERRIAR